MSIEMRREKLRLTQQKFLDWIDPEVVATDTVDVYRRPRGAGGQSIGIGQRPPCRMTHWAAWAPWPLLSVVVEVSRWIVGPDSEVYWFVIACSYESSVWQGF
jgi:hypothetical protein